MKRPRIDFIDRMILIEYEQGKSSFNGRYIRRRINALKLKRMLLKPIINSKRQAAND